MQIVVIAKEPLPGRVKTRLCPPCTPELAAQIARAALDDTLDTVSRSAAARRVLLVDGRYPVGAGWTAVPQRGDGLGARLAHGFTDTAVAGVATLLIGMDTPQVTPGMLTCVGNGLSEWDGILCPAEDGGWWALALRDPAAAAVLADVPMSRDDTCRLTYQAFTAAGLRLRLGLRLRDVDTMADARAVAAQCPAGRFAAAVGAAERVYA